MDYKICTQCGKELPAIAEFFHKSKAGKFGLRSVCNSCRRIQSIENKETYAQYYQDNKERFSRCEKKYREDHKDVLKKRRDKKKEKKAVYDKKYRGKNKLKKAVQDRKYREDNQKEITVRRAQYYQKNKKEITVKNKQYRKNNRGKFNAYSANYRAKKFSQTPILTEVQKYQIELLYKKCRELGSDWQVDHLIPLSKGGLHHPNNLQIVTKKYNLRKNDKLNFRLPTDTEIYKFEGSLLFTGKEEVS